MHPLAGGWDPQGTPPAPPATCQVTTTPPSAAASPCFVVVAVSGSLDANWPAHLAVQEQVCCIAGQVRVGYVYVLYVLYIYIADDRTSLSVICHRERRRERRREQRERAGSTPDWGRVCRRWTAGPRSLVALG